MWFKKASRRRQAIRDDVAEAEGAKRWWGGKLQFLAVAIFFCAVACVLQFWPGNPLPYRLGEQAPMDLKAQVTFSIIDPVRTDLERYNARLKSPPVLAADDEELKFIQTQLSNLRTDVVAAHTPSQLPPELQKRFPNISESAFNWLSSADAERLYQQNVGTFMDRLRRVPIVSKSDWETIRHAAAQKQVRDVQPVREHSIAGWLTPVPLDSVYVIGEPSQASREALLEIVRVFPSILWEPIGMFIENVREPTFRYDARLTGALEDRRAGEAMPVGETIMEGQVIVTAGQRIDARAHEVLLEAHEALRQKQMKDHPWAIMLSHVGRVLLVVLLTVAGTLYIGRLTQTRVTMQRAWAVCILLLTALVGAKLAVAALPQFLYCVGLMPTLLTAVILVIAYNQRFALGVAAFHALLVTMTLEQNIDFFVTLLAGVAVFTFGLGEIRTRSKLLEVGVIASAAIFVTVWAIGLARMSGSAWIPFGLGGVLDSGWVASQSFWGAVAGVGVAGVALSILPPMERLFKITTAMTLLELCDANKPLLQRLSQEAPGTFNHSLTVGIMAEAAGNAIGANGLLCRVGAYYHDVGKLSKPQYFAENGYPNRHDKLSPAMSLLIIVGHVKDGIELAREYRLPRIIHQFIGEHHGTTLVEYFYHAARKRAEQAESGGDGKAVSDTEFRYPGPKPQSREVAIVMICDGCESVVRSIDEPTPGRIETAVHNMVSKRLMDGQFSDCDLTLRDLSIIEETLVRTLAGIHHGRVAYPTRPQEGSGDGVPDVEVSQPA